MIYGIDISEWQKTIPAFKGDFIILRAGYKLTEDARFKEHYRSAIAQNKRVGVYWYSYALTPDEARSEARKCLEVIKGLNISMGVWFDMEDADGKKKNSGFKFTRDNISSICNAFCEITEKAGYYSGIYCNLDYIKNYVNCPKYDKWLAYWGKNDGSIPKEANAIIKKYGGSIWQYTSKLNGGSLDGDILMHSDIDMYNIQPSNKPTIDIDSIKADLKKNIEKLIDDAFSKLKEGMK